MNLFIFRNKQLTSKKAFQIIKKQVKIKPDTLIGLAAGKTTDSLYKLISKDALKHPKIWSRIKVFQIDERVGACHGKPLQSFNFELRSELKPLFKLLKPKNIFLMDGSKNPNLTIKEAKRFLKKNKEIDLLILGIGPKYDPHIAYNTRGKTKLNSSFRIIRLFKSKLKGITIGTKEILQSKKILLLAYGKDKAKSMELAFKKKININKVPASALQLHKDLYVVIDRDAGCRMVI